VEGSPSAEKHNSQGAGTGTGKASQQQQPFCQQHRANVCATYVGNKSIYVTSRYAQGLREDKVMGMYWEKFFS